MTQTAHAVDSTPETVCDVSQRFVRVLGKRDNGLVEFAFSIGWPELAVELMLPEADFQDFCATHKVRYLTD
jgi:phenol/toluene 2-monooxygenase (NADH) P0/A0